MKHDAHWLEQVLTRGPVIRAERVKHRAHLYNYTQGRESCFDLIAYNEVQEPVLVACSNIKSMDIIDHYPSLEYYVDFSRYPDMVFVRKLCAWQSPAKAFKLSNAAIRKNTGQESFWLWGILIGLAGLIILVYLLTQ